MMDRVKNRILVIEDDLATLDAIKLIFEIEDFNVLGLDSCAGLDKILDTFKPDIILMDVIMGTVDGREVCREMKSSKYREIPIILMSVVNDFEVAPAYPIYSDDCIEKPFDIEVLLQKVSLLLQNFKLEGLGAS